MNADCPAPEAADSTAWTTEHERAVIALGDGYGAAVRRLYPDRAAGAALYLHGIQSHSGWFLRSAAHLRAAGWAVLMADRRGSGHNQVQRGHARSAEQLLADVDVAVETLRRERGVDRVDLIGVSWGGKLAAAYAARRPAAVRRVVLAAPGLCPRIDVRLREKVRIGMNGLLRPERRHAIPLTEPSLFTANPEKRAFIAADPLMLRAATASFFLASRRLDQVIRRTLDHCPPAVHLLLAGRDRIIDNAATRALLAPVLAGGAEFAAAEHTLEFEPDPTAFLERLTAILAT